MTVRKTAADFVQHDVSYWVGHHFTSERYHDEQKDIALPILYARKPQTPEESLDCWNAICAAITEALPLPADPMDVTAEQLAEHGMENLRYQYFTSEDISLCDDMLHVTVGCSEDLESWQNAVAQAEAITAGR